jgi:glycosyltransferase involved in cell wall biosynthesis
LGVFVQARLHALARFGMVKVIAPIAKLDYSHPKRKWWCGPDVPIVHNDGVLDVRHPRWLFPPGGTPLNVLCLVIRLLPLLRQLRKEYPFDLIDAHFGYPEGAAAVLLAAAFKVPFIVTLRGSEPMFASYRFRRLCMRWALRRAAAVIAVSDELARFGIRLGAPAERVHTIQNGVDTGVFFAAGREEARARLGISPGKRLIVCAGELIEAKGHHLAITALAELVRNGHSDVILVVAGGVARGGRRYDHQLQLLVADLQVDGRVQLVGSLSRCQLAELMCAADVFTLPSFTEGCPNVINEALACGTPVVATAVGAVPQMIPDEAYGLIVPPRDQVALTAALARALDRKWDREAIASFGGSRTWSVVASEVMDIVRPVLGARSPSPDGP